MPENEVTLEELSERSSVERRTLRSWVSKGLLAPPIRSGRNARYPNSNVNRALAVRALKDVHGLALSEIRRRFMLASNSQIQEWVSDAASLAPIKGSAREYLQMIQSPELPSARKPKPSSKSAGSADRLTAPAASLARMGRHQSQAPSRDLSLGDDRLPSGARELAGVEQLLLQLEKTLKTSAPRHSRGTIWTRISVTPDLEISVRGELEPRERVLFEQLADQFRAILNGRIDQ